MRSDKAGAPKRIWAYDDGAFVIAFDYQTNVGGALPYILATPEALAKAPEVAALLAAAILDAQLRCMERGRIDTPNEIRTAAAKHREGQQT